MSMTFRQFSQENRHRSDVCYSDADADWTITDWTNAMCGEAGEAANVAKKLKRLKKSNLPAHREKLRSWLGEEIADTVIYAFLTADAAGLDLEAEIVRKWDRTSQEIGYEGRLAIS